MLAADESGNDIAHELLNTFETDWPLFTVAHAGEALRHAWRFDPRALFICVGTQQIDVAIDVINELRQRPTRHATRTGRALFALAAGQHHEIERSVRTAGATYYFDIHHAPDVRRLRDAIQQIGLSQPISTRPLSAPLSPPQPHEPTAAQSRASPPTPATAPRGTRERQRTRRSTLR